MPAASAPGRDGREPHPYIALMDRIAALPLRPTAKAVLWRLARWGRWDDGTNCFASVARLAADTGLSARAVQEALRWLECSPERAAGGRCIGGARCPHYGLVRLAEAPRRGTRNYSIDLAERAVQPRLPEIGPRPQRQPAAAADPYQRIVRTSWP